MQSIHLFLVFLFFSTQLTAQQYQDWGQAYGFKVGDKRYVYSDVANIRTAPHAEAAVGDSVRHGQEMQILKIENVWTMNGKEAPWCQVSYQKYGAEKTGYLWAGLLSPRSLRYGDVLFVYGMKLSPDPGESSLVDVKALYGDSLISRGSFKISPIETAKGAHEAGILDNRGLKGLECMLRFYYSGEACAIPTIEQYVGWDGKHFTMLPQVYSEADAGVYAVEQKYIFPADKMGKPGELRMREVIEEYDENADKPKSRKIKTVRYSWAAGKLRKL